eukprot:TRINITY_DN20192_c0_g1_i1.p1 TRINITY_DN20192_c0_g1~~TRINITY_DN20192_c0_g1_i1.p1  ORF type:complete len:629 (-),score=108.39 TRINITY_DN20192_c0_g1_i1:244-2130(-)
MLQGLQNSWIAPKASAEGYVAHDLLRVVSSPQRNRQVSRQTSMLQQPSLPLPRFSQPTQFVEVPGESPRSSSLAAAAAQGSSPLAVAATRSAAAIAAASAAAVALPAAVRQPQVGCFSSHPGTMTMMSAPVLPTAGAGGSLLVRSGSKELFPASGSAQSSPTTRSRNLTGSPGAQCQEVAATCICCKPVQDSREVGHGVAAPRMLKLAGYPEEVVHAEDNDLALTLQRVFGREGIQAIFGCASTQGARRLKCVGFNHDFMVELGGKLAKCIRPHAGAGGRFSEVMEAERLRHSSPSLENDQHALFPKTAFLCQAPCAGQGEFCCEILVFPFLEGCQSLGELVRSFERSHPCGVLRRGSACQEHLSDESGRTKCAHAHALHDLVRQAARLGRRFQALHGRRHGDFKADNLLLDRDGHLRLADFLSPFCITCDSEEFLKSLQSTHPSTQELQETFHTEWSQQACAAAIPDIRRNSWLQEELRQLLAASQQQSLFGPMPDLLQGISPLAPGGSPAGTMPAWFEPLGSRSSSSMPSRGRLEAQNGRCSPPAPGRLPSFNLIPSSFPTLVGSPLASRGAGSGSSSPVAVGSASLAVKPAVGMPGQYSAAPLRPVSASPFFPSMPNPDFAARLF